MTHYLSIRKQVIQQEHNIGIPNKMENGEKNHTSNDENFKIVYKIPL